MIMLPARITVKETISRGKDNETDSMAIVEVTVTEAIYTTQLELPGYFALCIHQGNQCKRLIKSVVERIKFRQGRVSLYRCS